MEYTTGELAKLAGISTRTLRYYDQLGLLSPNRESMNGYRVYGQSEVDKLQHILFYRELGVPLESIEKILSEKEFDGVAALESHMSALLAKQKQLNLLIANVQKTILTMKGETTMSDKEKFEGFKEKLIADNESKYGDEIRAKYGDGAIDASIAKVKGMTEEQYAEAEALSDELGETLKAAFEQGDPKSELAQKACLLHKKWLCHYWDSYSEEAHVGIAQMYVDDERFTAYYDKIAPGCAVFLRDAVLAFVESNNK